MAPRKLHGPIFPANINRHLADLVRDEVVVEPVGHKAGLARPAHQVKVLDLGKVGVALHSLKDDGATIRVTDQMDLVVLIPAKGREQLALPLGLAEGSPQDGAEIFHLLGLAIWIVKMKPRHGPSGPVSRAAREIQNPIYRDVDPLHGLLKLRALVLRMFI